MTDNRLDLANAAYTKMSWGDALALFTASDEVSPPWNGPVLVVGVGNSGADIAMDIVKHHPTWLSGKEAGAVPFRIEPFVGRNVLVRGVRFVGHHLLTVSTPSGASCAQPSSPGRRH
jgi:hypothetical protein